MQITGALFADFVQIGADQRLTVVGGVWDHFTVPALPQSAALQLALLAQRSPEDNEVTVAIEMTQPDGSVGHQGSAPLQLGHMQAENMTLTLTVPVEFTQRGRHVFTFAIDGHVQAALPLHIRVQEPDAV